MLEILPQLLINSLISGSIYALATVGMSLTYGLLRILNFAHGHIMMFGAYLFYFFYSEHNFSLLSASCLTVVCSALFSFLVMQFFIAPFNRYSLILTLVSTITLANILESVISIFFGVNVKSFSSGFIPESREWQGIFITDLQLLIPTAVNYCQRGFALAFNSCGDSPI